MFRGIRLVAQIYLGLPLLELLLLLVVETRRTSLAM